MKIKGTTLERRGDRLTLRGTPVDHLRRPAKVTVTIERGDFVEGSQLSPILEGDVRDVMGVLEGMAEAAWSAGWRPRGLKETLAATVVNYKIKPEEK